MSRLKFNEPGYVKDVSVQCPVLIVPEQTRFGGTTLVLYIRFQPIPDA